MTLVNKYVNELGILYGNKFLNDFLSNFKIEENNLHNFKLR